MNDKKKTNDKSKPVHVVCQGEACVSIYTRQANSGFVYHDLMPTRQWMSMKTGRKAHGTSFFPEHEEDLIRAIREAAAWIRRKQNGNPPLVEPNEPGHST